MRRRGELTKSRLNSQWPHLVALPEAPEGERYHRHDDVREFVRELNHAPRAGSIYRDGRWFHIHCFADPEHARMFKERFDGEDYDPNAKPPRRAQSAPRRR